MKDDSSEGVKDWYEAIISHNLGSKKSETSAADPVVMMKYWPTTLKNIPNSLQLPLLLSTLDRATLSLFLVGAGAE